MFPPMDMRQFLDTHDRDAIAAVAEKAGTKVIYMRQIGCGAKRPSALLARRFETASKGALTAAELRPDVFGTEQSRSSSG